MAASLVPAEGGSPIVLDKPIMLIGRNQDCDISLQVSSKISRRHCCIVQCGDRYVLRDLGSMN
ncbi:MAG TPA: FHA domain-containing protein, partial [Pirellulales bacterium]